MDQWIILIFTTFSSYLITTKTAKSRIAGCIFGLCSQPAWFYSTLSNKQYGMFVLSLWFTFCWSKGLYVNWREFKNESR